MATEAFAADALLIAIGAIPAAWLRFRLVDHLQPMLPRKHWGTFGVNVVACFALALIVALEQSCGEAARRMLLLLGTGFLGSFSTLSSFIGEWPLAGHGAMNAPSQRLLRREVRDLTLVAIGAIPGALGCWGCELLGERVSGGLRGVIEGDFSAAHLRAPL